jgi:hypothetical protein
MNKGIPERVFLQWYGQDLDEITEGEDVDPLDVTWCSGRIFDSDIEYVIVKR